MEQGIHNLLTRSCYWVPLSERDSEARRKEEGVEGRLVGVANPPTEKGVNKSAECSHELRRIKYTQLPSKRYSVADGSGLCVPFSINTSPIVALMNPPNQEDRPRCQSFILTRVQFRQPHYILPVNCCGNPAGQLPVQSNPIVF